MTTHVSRPAHRRGELQALLVGTARWWSLEATAHRRRFKQLRTDGLFRTGLAWLGFPLAVVQVSMLFRLPRQSQHYPHGPHFTPMAHATPRSTCLPHTLVLKDICLRGIGAAGSFRHSPNRLLTGDPLAPRHPAADVSQKLSSARVPRPGLGPVLRLHQGVRAIPTN